MTGDPVSAADAIVVGGGPAGSAAAITLARSGQRVTVVDRARFPRDKTCGDGLTAGALRLLESLGLDSEKIPSWQRVHGVVIRSPSGRQITFPLPRDDGLYAAVARRTDLDAALLELARSAGATVLDGHACTGVTETADHVEVELAGIGVLRSPWLVAADGMWSPVRKHLGLAAPGYRGEWHAFRQYFTDVGQRAATELLVWFEPDLLPGYVWSFPLPDRRANVGFGIQRGGRVERVQDMARLWPELLRRPHIRDALGTDARAESAHRAWPIPARIDRATLTSTRTLFVGDAAAATDVLTGEGIGQALLTGILAGRAIEVGGDTVPHRYRQLVRSSLMTDHRVSHALAKILAHPRSTRVGLRLAGVSGWTRRNFARWLFEDYPRAVLLTPRRWHRGMLQGPGAFRDAPGTREVRGIVDA